MPSLLNDPAVIALREMALALAAKGRAVFPCLPDKRPCTARGFKDASRDPDQIARWFDQPDILIGVATGEVSGITVLDVDAGKVPGAKTWRASRWSMRGPLLSGLRGCPRRPKRPQHRAMRPPRPRPPSRLPGR